MTIYLNIRTAQGVETVDEFTRGSDNAPEEPKEFNRYVNEMVKSYNKAYPVGMSVYKSRRCTKDWK